MDEVEAGKYIQAHWHIPVVYMTAYSEEDAWRTRHPASVRWADELFGYRLGDPDADLSSDERDGAAYGPLAVVIDPAFTWGDDRPPRTPWHKTIIYEVRVKGVPQLHSEVPERLHCWQVTR
jgi:pullulanase/glycogen debranching enzyme